MKSEQGGASREHPDRHRPADLAWRGALAPGALPEVGDEAKPAAHGRTKLARMVHGRRKLAPLRSPRGAGGPCTRGSSCHDRIAAKARQRADAHREKGDFGTCPVLTRDLHAREEKGISARLAFGSIRAHVGLSPFVDARNGCFVHFHRGACKGVWGHAPFLAVPLDGGCGVRTVSTIAVSTTRLGSQHVRLSRWRAPAFGSCGSGRCSGRRWRGRQRRGRRQGLTPVSL